MYSNLDQSNSLTDKAAQSADQAIKSTQNVANDALDGLSDTVQDIRQNAAPLLNRATEQASALAQRGADTVRDASQQLREKALRVSDSTVDYIKDKPVKSMMIAAASGAAMMALVRLMTHSRSRD